MLFNPQLFSRISAAAIPFLAVAAALLTGLGLWQGLIASPQDYQQGDYVRIMYVHVPAAWLALGLYGFMALCGGAYLIWRAPLADAMARAAAPVGAVFCALCLITGMIWAKPMWGTWWVWDARLTSVFVLFCLYAGYLLLAQAHGRGERAAVPLAVLSLIGAINLPVIKFSVEWWNTLHQPASILRKGGSSVHPDLQQPLMLMALGFAAYAALLVLMSVEAELAERRHWRSLRLR